MQNDSSGICTCPPKVTEAVQNFAAISAWIINQDRKGGATKSWKSSEITVESSKTFAFFISHSINLFHLISMGQFTSGSE